MKFIKAEDTQQRHPNADTAPYISVYFGGEGDSPDVGFLHIRVPGNGGGMPAHKHNGSDIVITAIKGSVVITREEESHEVTPGTAIQILRDEAVSLSNPNEEDAEIFVAAGPADFVREGVLKMPAA